MTTLSLWGYKYSTKAAVSIGIDDMKIPDSKWEIIEAAQQEVDKYEKAYRAGLVSNSERYEQIIKIWNKTTDDVADALMDSLEPANNLNIMATSGAEVVRTRLDRSVVCVDLWRTLQDTR